MGRKRKLEREMREEKRKFNLLPAAILSIRTRVYMWMQTFKHTPSVYMQVPALMRSWTMMPWSSCHPSHRVHGHLGPLARNVDFGSGSEVQERKICIGHTG